MQRRDNVFGHLYLSVCLHVCNTATFESLELWSAGTSSGDMVKFVHEGRRVKVKVTAAKKVENFYSHNVKLRSPITPVIKDRPTRFACVMAFSATADRMV